MDDRRHLSLVVLDEGQLRTVELDEEVRFRCRIDVECTLDGVLTLGLADQLVAFSPDRDFPSLGKRVLGRKFVLADDSIKKFGVELGETTGDQRYTLVELECLGSCGTAPVALVNEVLHENLTPAKLEEVVEKLPEEPEQYRDPTVTWEG